MSVSVDVFSYVCLNLTDIFICTYGRVCVSAVNCVCDWVHVVCKRQRETDRERRGEERGEKRERELQIEVELMKTTCHIFLAVEQGQEMKLCSSG